MLNHSFHKGFRLFGNSFQNELELLAYMRSNSIDGLVFLEAWFDKNEFIIAHTSGSTGVPKEIKIKKTQMLSSAKATGAYFNLSAGTSALLCMSSDFIAGKMMWVRALSLGWELDVVAVDSHPLTKRTKNYDFAAMVPLQVLNSIENLNAIRTLIIGGGVVSNELEDQLQNVTTKAFATYGMTETVTHIAVRKLNHIETKKKVYYNILPFVKIAKDNRGCLVINAPLIADKKVVTNDLISIKSETSFEWLGRFDSVINSGGLKLIPEQIEKKIAMYLSPQFFIAGIADALLGEKVVLLIEGKGTAIKDKAKIRAYLKNIVLERYEFPKEIHFVPVFELTETGKIKRQIVLKEIAKDY